MAQDVTAARRATGMDLAVHPAGAGAKEALLRYLGQLAPLAGGDRTAPTAPAALQVTGDGRAG